MQKCVQEKEENVISAPGVAVNALATSCRLTRMLLGRPTQDTEMYGPRIKLVGTG